MTEFGLDIDEDILVRLQVDDLLRCKSVCKSWNSLILSDRFVRSHLNRQHSSESRETGISVSRICCRLPSDYRLVGSSNGLVCFYSYENCFFVLNPSTRELKQLMNVPGYVVAVDAVGFGYDSSIDDFKVVIGSRENPNDEPVFDVLELKKNIWRSIYVEWEAFDYLMGKGILCNGALHWLHPDRTRFEIVSLDLSKEVFRKTSIPESDDKWYLGTMKDRLCIFRFPDTDLKENDDNIEMLVMRDDQVSWEPKLLLPGYDANKTTMRDQMNWECQLLPPGYDAGKTTMRDQLNWEWDYIRHRYFLSLHVHIWLLEEGSAAPVLLRSIDPSQNEHIRPDYHEHILLSTYSECSYYYDDHVFVKSLVSPNGMGNENVSFTEEGVKSKRENVISPDRDGSSVKRRRESPMSHNSDGGSDKIITQSLVFSDSDSDGWSVKSRSKSPVSHNPDGRSVKSRSVSPVYHNSDGGSVMINSQSLVSSDSDSDGRNMKSRSKSPVSHNSDGRSEKSRSLRPVYHNSDGGSVMIKSQSLVSSDSSNSDGRSMKSRSKSPVSHNSDGGRAKSKRQILVYYDSDGDGRSVKSRSVIPVSCNFDGGRASLVSSDPDDEGRRLEGKRTETESYAFHSSDKARAKSKRQSHVSTDCHGDGRRMDRKRRERDREVHVFHCSDKRKAKSKRESLVSSDSDGNGR